MGLRGIVENIGRTKAFAAFGKAVVPMDKVLLRLSGGRFGVGSAVGLRTLLLTTTGRSSGEPRQVPLLYVQRGDAYVVIGSNWGGQHHPAWSGNLMAKPEASASVRGRTVRVNGRLVTGDERELLWNEVASYWPAYDSYADRASQRQIRVFLLEPRS